MKNSIKKPLKIIKRVTEIVWWIIVVAIAVLMVSILSAKIKGEVPSVFGISVVKIVSGSMEPEIPSGSYILVKKTKPEDVKKDDIITFYSEDKTIYGLPNTHRVIDIVKSEDGGYIYTTKGDANVIKDSVPASSTNLIGVYKSKIVWLNSLENALNGKLMIVLMAGIFVLIIAFFFLSLFYPQKNGKNEEGESGE